ncbi:MAG TPA: AAA family ATPase, partial [Polyangiaceae bacterium]|nr:AAA family ATPase [Polyangiaceae bacterium]
MLTAFIGGTDAGAMLLEGEPGIGKTSLWRSGLIEAQRSGKRVIESTPASGETQLAFSVLSDLLEVPLRDVASHLPRPQRRSLEVALLLAEDGGEAQQRTVLSATLSTLRELSQRTPVLLAIDDMQWVDAASADALAFAIRRLGNAPVSFLGAKRPEAPTNRRSSLEAALVHRHAQEVERIGVQPLSMGALHDAIRGRLGVSFPPSVMQRIQETSGGNPFYALELARALAKHHEPLEPGGVLPVPDTLQQIVGQRLDALSADAQSVLAYVALLSNPTMDALLASGLGSAINEPFRAGLLEMTSGDRVRFTHPLFASTVSARLTAPDRRALHAHLATLVDGEERARHLAQSASGPSSEVADELHREVQAAAARGAVGTAAELAEQSIRLTPTDDVDVLAQRRLETATFEIRLGDARRARAHLEPLLAELPAGPMRAGVLLQLARLHESEATRALSLCEQAIAEAGPADARAAAAHQLAAEMSMLSGNIPAALDHARRACTIAESTDDRSLLIESLGTLCHYQTYTGTVEDGLLERAVELERSQVRASNNYSPREIMGLRLMYADRLDEARALLEESLLRATDIGDELDRGSLLIHLTQLECRSGRLAAAAAHAREVTISKEQAGSSEASARFASALVDAHLGRVSRARADGEEGAAIAAEGGSEVFRVLNLWALGFLELSLGNTAAADGRLRPLPALVDAMGYRNPGVRPVHADAIEARIGAGDIHDDVGVDVQAQIADLEQRGQQFSNPTIQAAAIRCRGLLLLATDKLDEGLDELSRAVIQSEASPQPLERGRCLLAHGSALRRQKRRREARDRLTAALEIFDNLGTPLWAEKAAAEIARIPGRTMAAGGLTPTQRRVAELVAEGLSNKEVASTLVVSV